MNHRIAASVAAGALVLGAAGASFLIPSLVAAADPTASPSATSSTGTSSSGSSTTQASPSTSTNTMASCAGMPGGMAADDITAAANALGMTEANLTTALQGGQTIADVASSEGIAVQTVIDAMVAAEKAEIQAQVDAGTITQAQADQQVANLTAHETDEVNGVAPMGGGHGRHGGPPGTASGTGSSNGATTTNSSTSTRTTS